MPLLLDRKTEKKVRFDKYSQTFYARKRHALIMGYARLAAQFDRVVCYT